MKLVQLNAWQGRLLRQILQFLKEEQPDFMTFQEIYSGDIRTSSYGYLNCFEEIQELFPDYESYFSPCYTIPVLDRRFRYGNAVLSRYPLTDKETIFTHGAGPTSLDSFAAYKALEGQQEPSNVQRVKVQVSKQKSFYLVNHHGYWEPSATGSETTVEKMAEVAKLLKATPRPLILSGDLNIVPESPAMKPIHAQLDDLTQRGRLTTTLTRFGKVKNVACDHICISDDIKVQTFMASSALVSDHMPIILTFDL